MSDQTIPGPELVSLEDAAKRLGISKATAYRLRRISQFPIPVIQVGFLYRVRAADLDEFITGKSSVA